MVLKSNKNKVRIKIYLESLLVFFIAISPFLYKLYEYLPSNSDGTISIFGMVFSANGFPDTATYLWFLTSKIIPLYLLIFWFLTSRNWWYHIIIIPIAMYAFQLFEVIYDSDDIVDTKNIWWLLPVCMIVIPIVYFIRVKLYDKHVHGIDLEAMDAELQELKQKMGPEETSSGLSDDDTIEKETYTDESLSDKIDRKLSTESLEQGLKQFSERLKDWKHS
ncbi:hypothetical protein [Maribacter sp. 2210JD10-5]|uniref:hypothetical protein n=1 Tax=Maribacter sp. 2210JD10-5 TaxID=3386272 RepID=UPI0039BD9325